MIHLLEFAQYLYTGQDHSPAGWKPPPLLHLVVGGTDNLIQNGYAAAAADLLVSTGLPLNLGVAQKSIREGGHCRRCGWPVLVDMEPGHTKNPSEA